MIGKISRHSFLGKVSFRRGKTGSDKKPDQSLLESAEWMKKRICKVLRDNKIEMYREDNNIEAIKLWRKRDALEDENYAGITECIVIMNHYIF